MILAQVLLGHYPVGICRAASFVTTSVGTFAASPEAKRADGYFCIV